jgi:hypothetical protein
MSVAPLPPNVAALLASCNTPPCLVRHLTLVHDAAVQIVAALDQGYPGLAFDRGAVLFGAATHDAGKVLHPDELSGPGTRHEEDGPALLVSLGVTESLARFAHTHGAWSAPDATLEDLLVAWADNAWKGKRVEALELRLTRLLSERTGDDAWHAYMFLDDLATSLGRDAAARIAWQSGT